MFPVRLGLKASCDPIQVASRLTYQPEIFEFYTSEHDFTPQGLKMLRDAIETVKMSGVKHIILHQPMKYQGQFLELVAHPAHKPELVSFINETTKTLLELANAFDCKVLVHGSYDLREKDLLDPFETLKDAQDYLFSRIDALWQLGGNRIMFENGISNLFSFGYPDFDQVLLQKGYPLAYDISHAFIFLNRDNVALQRSLSTLKKNIVHYHLVDSFGKRHDSLPLGQGKVDWAKLLPLLNSRATSIYEINLANVTNPKEQVASHAYLKRLVQELN